MSYYYDSSGNSYYSLPTLSGSINYTLSGLTGYIPKTSTLSGVINYTSVSGAVSYVQSISGLFTGFTSFNSYFTSYTISSYINNFAFLTASGYVSPFITLTSISSLITVSGATYITGSGSGIDSYARQLAYSISGSVYAIQTTPTIDQYSRSYELSLSGYVWNYYNTLGTLISNNASNIVDQYSRNYELSLSGVVYSYYNTLGNLIYSSSGTDQYARLFELSLSGYVWSYYNNLGNQINIINSSSSSPNYFILTATNQSVTMTSNYVLSTGANEKNSLSYNILPACSLVGFGISSSSPSTASTSSINLLTQSGVILGSVICPTGSLYAYNSSLNVSIPAGQQVYFATGSSTSFFGGSTVLKATAVFSSGSGSGGTDTYSRLLSTSLSGIVYSNYQYQGNLINTLVSGNVDQYARNYDLSLSGQLNSVYYSHGASLNYLSTYDVSLSGQINNVYYTYGSSLNYLSTYDLSLSGQINNVYYSNGSSLNYLSSYDLSLSGLLSTVNQKTYNITYSNGATNINNNLFVSGTSWLYGNVATNSTFNVNNSLNSSVFGVDTTGNLTMLGTLTAPIGNITNVNASNIGLTGNCTVGNTLSVTGTSTMTGALTVNNNFTSTGSSTIGGQLVCNGTIKLPASQNNFNLGYNNFGVMSASNLMNLAFGYASLTANTSGTNNISIGASNLTNNTTGSYNIAIGYDSGVGGGLGTVMSGSQTTGSWNTFLGSYAGNYGNNSYSTAIGYNSRITASYQTVLAEATQSSVVLGGAYNYINMDCSTANSTSTLYPLTLTPGAYLVNAGYGVLPIFADIPDFSNRNIGMDNTDDSWMVMPGFKLQIWSNASYSSQSITCDNTTGSTIALFFPNVSNACTSCKLWYKGTELANTLFNYMGSQTYA